MFNRTTMGTIAALLAILCALCLLGCDNGETCKEGEDCSQDPNKCEEGLAYDSVTETCLRPCEMTLDCQGGQACYRGFCQHGPEDECQVGECPAGEECRISDKCRCDDLMPPEMCNLECRPPFPYCFSDSTCEEDFFCSHEGSYMHCGSCAPCWCYHRYTNRHCILSYMCGCEWDADCAEGQTCEDWGCSLDGVETECGDEWDSDEDGLTDCEDIEDCELRSVDQGRRCEGGEPVYCSDVTCIDDSDCAGCVMYPVCIDGQCKRQ